MRIVAPFGFYGAGNTGDEGTLQGFARLIALSQHHASVSIASMNPAHCARVEPSFSYFKNPGGIRGIDPRRWWAMMRGTVHAVIGGTPIMDVLGDWPLAPLAPILRASEQRKVPFLFIGCGVEGLRSDESRTIMRRDIVPRVRYWTVRAQKDRDRLLEYGVAPHAASVAADMAWLIEPPPRDAAWRRLRRLGVTDSQPLIGVSVVNENSCFDRFPQMRDAVAVALDGFIAEHGARVVFFSAEMREGPTFDVAAARKIMASMKHADEAVSIPNEYLSPSELLGIIGACTFTLSMRYHVCLFSALQGVPFLAIERADKVSDLCWDLAWSARVVPPKLKAADLLEHGRQLLQHREALRAHLRERVRSMQQRALLNAAALDAPLN